MKKHKYKLEDIVWCFGHQGVFQITRVNFNWNQLHSYDSVYIGGPHDYVGKCLSAKEPFFVTMYEKDLTSVSKIVTMLYKAKEIK